MGSQSLQETRRAALWKLAARQHGIVSRTQLLALGFPAAAIDHRRRSGRLHGTGLRAIYAVGRPDLTAHGRWMAAVLACGAGAALSHLCAAACWRITRPGSSIDVSIPATRAVRHSGVVVHRKVDFTAAHRTTRDGIVLTTPAVTLVDLASELPQADLEAAINAADRLRLIDPQGLRRALDELPRWHGVAALHATLDRATFRLTDSELERRFLRIIRRHRLPLPATGAIVNGFKVDFYWPSLGLVVETDGLRYHRTASQQLKDRRRDQVHTAAGLTTLRFTHGQVTFDAAEVGALLARTIRRLSRLS